MLTMLRLLILVAFSLLFTNSIIPGFEKDKTCPEPCKLQKPKASSSKNLQKSNISHVQEIKKDYSNTNTINIHSSSSDLKEIIRKKVQPNFSESHSIDRIKIATREELNKYNDIKLNKKFLPSPNQNIGKSMYDLIKKKEIDFKLEDVPFKEDTLNE